MKQQTNAQIKKNKELQIKRPPIPQSIQLELWVKAAGRCEFLGCNKPLWRDGLTLQRVNYSNISHIISWTPTGPRGDTVLSAKLSQDISNLMLTCKEHGHLIDRKEYEAEYGIQLLRSYKKNHEDRISIQTSHQENMRTKLLIFSANIDQIKVTIPQDQAVSAITPKYPDSESGIVMDYTNLRGDGDLSYWKNMADEITGTLNKELFPLVKSGKISSLAIFGIGPIPLLIHLGKVLGNAIPADIYQRHRDTEDWLWKKEKNKAWKGHRLVKHKVNEQGNKIALVLSLSGSINLAEVTKVVDEKYSIYEITHDKPHRDYLSTKDQLIDFQQVYQKTLAEVRKVHGDAAEIHIFPAIPVSVAIACGRELLPKSDPDIYIYDNHKNFGGFRLCLEIKKTI